VGYVIFFGWEQCIEFYLVLLVGIPSLKNQCQLSPKSSVLEQVYEKNQEELSHSG